MLGENMDSGFFVSFVNYFNGIINKIEKHRLFFLCYNGKRLKIQQDIVGKKGKKKQKSEAEKLGCKFWDFYVGF